MKNFKTIGLTSLLITFSLFQSCSDLEEEALDGVRQTSAETEYAVNDGDPADLLAGAYANLRGAYQTQDRLFCLDEHTTDAVVGPTRGGDWDDNGQWRSLHTQTYASDHPLNLGTFVDLFSAVNQCDLVLGAGATGQIEAEARFLRAMHYYHGIDLWGQVPYRIIGSDPNADALVYTRSEATDWVISELEAIINNLPAGTNAIVASQNAAHWLLAKMYLNKAVFKADNPAGPYTFENADMEQVVAHVDAISGVSLASDYWDNFRPANSQTSPEIIFVSENIQGGPVGNIQSRWRMGQHYNQTPGGWNGFTTLSEYYQKFDPNDERINHDDPLTTQMSGYKIGFQIGQQYGPGGQVSGTEILDRTGEPLVFTEELSLVISGDAIENAGIRGVKYIPDHGSYDNPDNDFVIARYADALLMKAEAMARMGDTGGAQTLVQNLEYEASTPINSVDDILEVRARELWWEGWRRNDRVRFGVFLEPMELKDFTSPDKAILMPIPSDALANPNFTQNPGY